MNEAARRQAKVRAMIGLAVLVGIVAACVMVALRRAPEAEAGAGRPFRDFYEFYSAAKTVREGGDAQAVFSAGKLGYIYPPLLAVALMPLVPMGIQSAAAVWTVFSAACLAGGLVLSSLTAARGFGAGCERRLWVWLPAGLGGLLVADKLLSEFKMHQSNSLMLLGWALAAWGAGACIKGGGKLKWWGGWGVVLAGLGIALGFNIKYVTIVAVGYLLVRGAWRAAGWAVAWTAALALGPALLIGWTLNADLWRGAIAGLTGGGDGNAAAGGVARVMSIENFGISITTVMLGHGERMGDVRLGWLMAAALGLAVVGVVWVMYKRAGVSLLNWRPLGGRGEIDAAGLRLIALEWAGLVVGVLAFSPQTNARHITQAALTGAVMIAAALWLWSLALDGAGRVRAARRYALAGIAVFWMGLVLPPGTQATREIVLVWQRSGGICACMVIGWLLVLWGVLSAERGLREGGGAAVSTLGRRGR